MPKYKNKQKSKGPPSVLAEEEDNCSVSSDFSESNQNSEEDGSLIENDVYEKKIQDAIDLAAEKSALTRTNALISLKTGLQKRIMTAFLLDNYQTLADIVERSIKKGQSIERIAAAKLASVLMINLAGTDEAEQLFKILQPCFSIAVQDPSLSAGAKREISFTLSLMVYLACPEPAFLTSTLNVLHNVFCKALPKGNGELPNNSSSVVALHTAALQGVCLLLTLMVNATVCDMAHKLLEELKPMLKSSDLDMRIIVGEAFALVYEISRERFENFRWKSHNELLSQLEEMLNESHKYVAKKDRKAQRASFREIVQSISDGEPFSETVYIGPSNHQQPLVLSSWALRIQYQALCHALEQGLNVHMIYNPALRDLFDLGPPPDPTLFKTKVASGAKKSHRQTPEVKARLLARSKNRDNRAAALSYDD